MADIFDVLNPKPVQKPVAKPTTRPFDAFGVVSEGIRAGTIAKKPVKKPNLAQPVKGTRVDGVLNEGTGELKNEKGQKIKRNTVTLANGMTLSFDSNRELTPDELQETVNSLGDHPDFLKQEKDIAARQKAQAAAPRSTVGPVDNARLAQMNQERYEQLTGPQGLDIARKMTPEERKKLSPEVMRILGGKLFKETVDAANNTLPTLSAGIGQAIDTVITAGDQIGGELGLTIDGKPMPKVPRDPGTGGLLVAKDWVEKQAKKDPEFAAGRQIANVGAYFLPYVGQMRGAVDTANMAQRITQGEGVQVAKETLDGLNVFDDKITEMERGMRALNVLGTIYGGYTGGKTAFQQLNKVKQIKHIAGKTGLSFDDASAVVNMADTFEATITPPAKSQKPTIQPGVRPPTAEGGPIQGPQRLQFGVTTGATTPGRRTPAPVTTAIPVETPGVADRGTRTILNRADKIRIRNEREAAEARRAESQNPTLALPARTPEPAPVQKVIPQANRVSTPVVKTPAPVAEPKVETPAPTPKEPSAAKVETQIKTEVRPSAPVVSQKSNLSEPGLRQSATKEPWQMTRDELDALQPQDAIRAPKAPKRGTSQSDESWAESQKLHRQQVKKYKAADHAYNQWYRTANSHKNSVESALKEGKPVPASVLADYPDLAAKYKPVAKVETPVVAPKTPEQAVSPIVRDLHTPRTTTKPIAAKGKPDKNGLQPDQKEFLTQGIRDAHEAFKAGATEPITIKVPRDGEFTVKNTVQTEGVHEAITGKFIDLDPKVAQNIKRDGRNYRVNPIDRPNLLRDLTDGDSVFLKDGERRRVAAMPKSGFSDEENAMNLAESRGKGELWVTKNNYDLKPISVDDVVAVQLRTNEPFVTPKVDKLDAAYEAAVKSRAKGGTNGGTGNKNTRRGASDNPIAEAIADYAIIAAYHIRNGARTGRDVLKKLIKDHPYDEALIRANFNRVYSDARSVLDKNPRVTAPKATSTPKVTAEPAPTVATPKPTVTPKPAVTAEGVGVKSAKTTADPNVGKTGVWKGPDADQPIKIEATLGTQNGRTYVKIEGSRTGVPLDEITFDAPAPSSPKPSGTRTRASAQKAATAEPAGADPNVTSPKNAATAESRASVDLGERIQPKVKPNAVVVENANRNYKADAVDAKVDRHLSDPRKNVLSDEDGVQLRRRAVELEDQYKAEGPRILKETDPDAISAAINAHEETLNKLTRTYEALESTGSVTAQTLQARKILINRDSYSYEGIARAKMKETGKSLTPDEQRAARQTADEIAAADAAVERVRAEAYAEGRKAAEAEMSAQIASERANVARRQGRKADVTKTRADIVARMRKVGSPQQAEALGTQALYTMAKDIKDLAKTYIEEGVNGLDDLTKKVTSEMRKNGLDIDDAEFHDVFSGAVAQSPGRNKVLSQLEQLRKEARALGPGMTTQKRRLESRIAEWEKKLEIGDVSTKAKKSPKFAELNDKELRLKTLQRRVDMERKKIKAAQEYEALGFAQKAGKQIAGVLGIPRTVFSSIDLSAPGRQNWFNFIAHPVISSKALGAQFSSLTRGGYERAAANIRRNKDFDLANNSGLHLSTEALEHGEEAFVSRHLSRAWELGGRDFNPFAASERAYSGYLSTVRMNLFEMMANDYRKAHVPITPDIAKAIARHVNITTGRGVGKAGDIAGNLSAFGFAPRYTVSKFQTTTANGLRSAIQRGDTVAMKRIAADYAKVLGTVGTMAGLSTNYLKEKTGVDTNVMKDSQVKVEWRPNATNFGRAQYKDVTVDLLGGQQEVIRLLAKLKDGSINTNDNIRKDGTRKELKSGYDWTNDRAMTLWYYLKGKAAPSISLSSQISEGEGFGKSMDPKTQEGQTNIAKRTLGPGVYQTADELIGNKKLTDMERFLLTVISAGGFGVNDQSAFKK